MIHLFDLSNSRDIIRNVFSPLIGCITSPLADEMCHKNNLTFVELLQPFAKLGNDAHFRDISGTSVSIKGLRLNICDIDWRPPQTILARKMLNDAVTNASNDKNKVVNINDLCNLEIPLHEPWFEGWREAFLTVQFPSDHEFTRHFLSCLIILDSSDPNILDTANQLLKKVHILQNVPQQKLPKWFQPNDVLNSYILLYDGAQGDISKAQQSYELLKSTFGENKCFLVKINSSRDQNEQSKLDYWKKFIKRQPNSDGQEAGGSAPKTPQDTTIAQMPPLSNESENSEQFLHPLSPMQEQATEAIHSKFSISSESISSQTINPNVWTSDLDIDAPHGILLNSSDIENLRHFIQDYTIRALIPYIEKLVGMLNETITNKKGVSKSLFSATKRLFATSKPVAGSGGQNAVIYTNESCELQTRKLGDLYFMFGHYNLAFQAYHQAKRDFNADSAWQYFAGALEMAALSAFMLGTSNRKTYDYMESAIETYLTSCKLQQFATRATLLSVECLKQARLYGEAAKQLIRMTSEDSDLRSALLLEQASYCFLSSQSPMYRKYAFHIVLSGNRYSRCGQRKHAFRCYKQAYQVFKGRNWSLAEDHIQYTIGKQAVTLKKLDIASKSLAHLLRPESLQNVNQQAAFLKEYILTQKELLHQNTGAGILEIALPKVVQSSIKVLVTSHPSMTNPLYTSATNININLLPVLFKTNLKDEFVWNKLEEMLVTTALPKLMIFKPIKSLFTSENPTIEHPLSMHGDPIEISVSLFNTIKPSISFSSINLLWVFKLETGEIISNRVLFEKKCNQNEINGIQSIIGTVNDQEIFLNENEKKTIHFKLIPKVIGSLNIIGIIGSICATNETNGGNLMGCMYFEPQKIKNTERILAPEQKIQLDNKLNIEILPQASSLHVSFSNSPKNILTGEIIPIQMCLKNAGNNSIQNIYVCSANPRCITYLDGNNELPLSILRDFKDLTNKALSKDKETKKQHICKLMNGQDSILKPQESKNFQLWIQAPYEKGDFNLRILIYYDMPADYVHVKYRLVRHEWHFKVIDGLQAEVNCIISNAVTNDLGLDFELKNITDDNNYQINQNIELYIDSINLFSSQFKLCNDNIIYTNKMELLEGNLNGYCLKSMKSTNFRIKLISNEIEKKNATPQAYVKDRISTIQIEKIPHTKNIPIYNSLFSFLMKNETKLLNVFNPSNNTEEFNNIILTFDPHITIGITWIALIVDGMNLTERIGCGEHFIQLRCLYQQICCPGKNRIKTTLLLANNNEKQYHKIHDFKNKLNNDGNEHEDEYEPNSHFIGKRCLLEDEIFGKTVSLTENNKIF